MTKSLVLRFQDKIALPRVPVPDIKGLKIVAGRVPVTEDDVAERFAYVLRAAASTAPRKRGEAVRAGDEVEFDLLAYANGRPLPLGVAVGSTMTADDLAAIPSIGTRLPGVKVGSSVQIQGAFPREYPVAALAAKTAVFIIDVKGAVVVTVPNLRPEGAVASLGLGDTLEDALAAVARELASERESEFEARKRMAIASELVRRTPFDLPRAFLEHEVGRRWFERDGKHLSRRRCSEKELTESYEAWLAEPILMREIERDVRAALLIRSLLESRVVTLDSADFAAPALHYAISMGATTEKAVTDLLSREDPTQSTVVNAMAINAALDKLAAKAEITSLFG